MIRRLFAVLALVAAAVVAPAAPARAEGGYEGPCTDNVGITVVVDFQELGGGVNVRCAPGPVTSGFDAFDKAGISWEGTRRFPGLVCRIAGKPGPDTEACGNAPPATAYWAYWLAPRGGEWCYSTVGAGTRQPPPGSIEGWSFSQGKVAVDTPPPHYAPPPPIDGQPANPLSAADCGQPVAPPTSAPAPSTTVTVPSTAAPTAPPVTQPPAAAPPPADPATVPDAEPTTAAAAAPGDAAAPAPANAAPPSPTTAAASAGPAAGSATAAAASVSTSSTTSALGSAAAVGGTTAPAPTTTGGTTATSTTSVPIAGDARSTGGAPATTVVLGTVDLSTDGRGGGGFGLATAAGIVVLLALAGTGVWAARRRRLAP